MSDDKINLSRRQAIAALGAGAVAVTVVGAGAAYEAATQARDEPLKQLDAAQKQASELQKQNGDLQAQLSDMEAQLSDMQNDLIVHKGLVALYSTLESIPMDTVIAGALGGYKALLDGLKGGVDVLRGAVKAAEGALDGLQNTFTLIRGALVVAEGGVANVGALLKNVQDLLNTTTAPAQPFIEQARQFFDDLLGKIPFGAGDQIRKTVNGTVGLVVAVPSMLSSVKDGLIAPLRDGWFSDDSAKNLQGALIEPLKQNLLEPIVKFLDDVEATLGRWESDVSKPINAALADREAVRKQIGDYRQQHGLN